MPRIKVAVVGAGAAGLCAGRRLVSEPSRFEFEIYEQQDDVGGTWRYSTHIGTDEYGLPVHSSMYKNLRTNLPKETMAFPDFPFQDCGGKSFLHHTQVLEYLKAYAEKHDLYKYIKFHKQIENIRPLKQGDGVVEWSVSYRDVITKEQETYIYDAVMVCNGHYSVPYTPEIEGLSDFAGTVLHSHDYREPEMFRDLKVVVLGAGASGVDIGIEIAAVAKEVIMSHNGPTKISVLPDNLRQESGIKSVDKLSVTFMDGKCYRCDTIVLCTGYLYHYPFLDTSCNVMVGDQIVSPLFKHLFLIDFPTLAIWAIPKLILPFPIYDQQVKVFLKFLKGVIELPSPDEMRADTDRDLQKRFELGLKPRYAHLMRGELQWEYDDALSRLGKMDPIPDVVRNLFRHVHLQRTMDFVNYKNLNYKLIDDKLFEQID